MRHSSYLIGLGKIGSQVAKIGQAFGMQVVAWSENLDLNLSEKMGVLPMTKDELLKQSDIISLHVVFGDRYKNLISKKEFDKGLAILSECIKNSKSTKDIRQMQLRKADYHISNGQKIEAEKIIDKLLLDEDLSSWNKQVAQEIKGKILS